MAAAGSCSATDPERGVHACLPDVRLLCDSRALDWQRSAHSGWTENQADTPVGVWSLSQLDAREEAALVGARQ